MHKSPARPMCSMILLAVMCVPSYANSASWEVGTSYVLEIISRDLSKWEYFGQRVSVGIVDFVTPTMQLGGYAGYGRYRYSQSDVFDPAKLLSWRSGRTDRVESAVDLGVILRAIAPPATQRVREFVFFSYAVRMTDPQDWRDSFDAAHLFTVGFGGIVRFGEGTRLLIQSGPTFNWDMSYGTMPVSIMFQFGSP